MAEPENTDTFVSLLLDTSRHLHGEGELTLTQGSLQTRDHTSPSHQIIGDGPEIERWHKGFSGLCQEVEDLGSKPA